MPTKISFFQYIASIVESFLRIFQSDGPLAPFPYQELEKIMRLLMQNFIKMDILTEAKSTFKLMRIDLQQSKCDGREVKIGIATSLLLAKIKVGESRKSHFHGDCLKFYIGMVNKLRGRSPLRYKLTRAVSALNPVIIYFFPYLEENRMNEVCVILHDSKRINATIIDKGKFTVSRFLWHHESFPQKRL